MAHSRRLSIFQLNFIKSLNLGKKFCRIIGPLRNLLGIRVPTLKDESSMKSALLILTNYFLIDPQRIGGGIGEHYAGFYGTFIKKYSRNYKIYWYSTDTRTLRAFGSSGTVMNSTMTLAPLAIFKAVNAAKKNNENKPLLTVTIAYHYVATRNIISFLALLLLLQFLRIAGLANTIIDIIDPPVEVHLTYSESPSRWNILFGTVLDILTLKSGAAMWFCSNSYQKYLTRKYRIPLRRTRVIYDGSLHNLVKPKPPRKEGPLTLFYSGSLLNVKGISELIEAVGNLRNKDLEVNLLLTGGHLETDKPWLKSLRTRNWFEWKDLLSKEADICVVPYPRKIHWDLAQHIKLVDYMAAGKPIVSMYYHDTASILKKYKCGLSAHDWKEFEDHIARLYYDRGLAEILGENGRKAAEQFFNFDNASEKLHTMIQDMLQNPMLKG